MPYPPSPSKNISWNTVFAWLLVLVICGASFSACSHYKPYYGTGLNPPGNQPVVQDGLRIRLLLLGDAGNPRANESNLILLKKWADKNPDRTMVIYLGDNVYDHGMPVPDAPDREEMERRLQTQLDILLSSGAQGFFVAGNHDWNQGLSGLQRESDFIQKQLGHDRGLLPPAGCPGPEYLDVDNIRIIVIDSNLWLHSKLEKATDCFCENLQESLIVLKSLLKSAGNRHVIVLAHHPLDSHGHHGGFYDWKDHLFPLREWKDWMWLPLPVLGSLYTVLRWNVVRSNEELNGRAYKEMIRNLKEAYAYKKPLIHASGHDHSLEVMRGTSPDYILVSGAGIDSRLSRIRHGENTLFAHLHEGFMAVDFLGNGDVWLHVIEPGPREVVFSHQLFGKVPLPQSRR